MLWHSPTGGLARLCSLTLPATEAVTATPLYLDYMSVIMVLAVGIVGSLICVYALGYMKDFQAHDEHEAALRGQTAPDRRPQFLRSCSCSSRPCSSS